MKVVYPIRNHPKTKMEDSVLKYSLRSIEKFGMHYGKVFMVGARRNWFSKNLQVVDLDLCGVKDENVNPSKFTLVGEKLRVMCSMNEPFVLMNDDFILTKPFDFTEMKWYWATNCEAIMNSPNKGARFKRMVYDTCVANGVDLSTRAFVTHTPFLVDVPEIGAMANVAKTGKKKTLSFRQTYAILRGVHRMPSFHAVKMEKDCKVYQKKTKEQWLELFNQGTFLSLNLDSCRDQNMMDALDEFFPTPSPFEKTNIDDILNA